MYKNILKKLLAFSLAVAMVAGVVELPKIAFAEGEEELLGAAVSGNVVIKGNETKYTGNEIDISNIVTVYRDGIQAAKSTYDVYPENYYEKVQEVGTYNINVKFHYEDTEYPSTFVVLPQDTYSINAQFETYLISGTHSFPYTPDDLPVVYYNEDVGERTVTVHAGDLFEPKYIKPDEGYTISDVQINGIGHNKGECNVTVKTNNLASITNTSQFDVALALDNETNVIIDDIGQTGSNGVYSVTYTGSALFSELNGLYLMVSDKTQKISLLSSQSRQQFNVDVIYTSPSKVVSSVEPENIKEAGTYNITVSTKGNFASVDPLIGDTEFYGGSTSLTLTVNKKNMTDGYKIYDNSTGRLIRDYSTSGTSYRPVAYHPYTDFSVYYGDDETPLVLNTDYVIDKDDDSGSGTGEVTLNGIGDYSGRFTFLYTIKSDMNLILNQTSRVYDPSNSTIGYTVTNASGAVISSDNYDAFEYYDVDASDPDNTGTYNDGTSEAKKGMTNADLKKVVVRGKEGTPYEGQERQETFEVTPYSAASLALTGISNSTLVYGEGGSPVSRVEDTRGSTVTLEEGVDYYIEYYSDADGTISIGTDSTIFDAGVYYYRVKGIREKQSTGNYNGQSAAYKVTITGLNIEDMDVKGAAYNGNAVSPTVYLSSNPDYIIYADNQFKKNGYVFEPYDSGNIVSSTDETVAWDGKSAGSWKFTLRGIGGNYVGTKTFTFIVERATLTIDQIYSENILWSDGKEVEWTGGATEIPSLTVKNKNGDTMTSGTDYTVEYSNNTTVNNSAKALVTMVNSNYVTGSSQTLTYVITPRSFTNNYVVIESFGVTPVSGNGVYEWKITNLIVSDTGRSNYRLVEGTDYTISYSNNTTAIDSESSSEQTATFTITGMGNYKDTLSKTYLCGYDINDSEKVKITGISNVTYTGYPQPASESDVIVRYGTKILEKDKDYTITFLRNDGRLDELGNEPTGNVIRTLAGIVTVTIQGKGLYVNSRTLTYTINPMEILARNVDITIDREGSETWDEDRTFTGNPIIFDDVHATFRDKDGNLLTLYENYDYEFVWSNNVNARARSGAMARVTVVADGNTGNYKISGDEAYYPFEILQRKMEDVSFELTYDDCIYSGKKNTPTVNSAVYNGYELDKRDFYTNQFDWISNNIDIGSWNRSKVGTFNRVYVDSLTEGSEEVVVAGTETMVPSYYVVNSNGTYGGGHIVMCSSATGNFKGFQIAYYDIRKAKFPLSDDKSTITSTLSDAKVDIADGVIDLTKYVFRYIHPGSSDPYQGSANKVLTVDDYELINSSDKYKYDISGMSVGNSNSFIITGKGNFEGDAEIPFKLYHNISNTDSTDIVLNPDLFTVESGEYYIDVNKLKTVIESADGEKSLVVVTDKNTDQLIGSENYTVTISNYAIGSSAITVSGVEDNYYTGTTGSIRFYITGDISTSEITVNDVIYTGKAVEAKDLTVSVKNSAISAKGTTGTTELRAGTDYEITEISGDYINPGVKTAIVKIKGTGQYRGETTAKFSILYPVEKLSVRLSYNGQIKWYADEYKEAYISKGVAREDNFGKLTVEFTGAYINPDVAVYYNYLDEDGNFVKIVPVQTSYYDKTPKAQVSGDDSSFINAGTWSVTVTPKETSDNEVWWATYDGTTKLTRDFEITPKDISTHADWFDLMFSSHTYTGGALRPALSLHKDKTRGIDLVEGTDYSEPVYRDNIEGNNETDRLATVVINGKGNYTGTVNKTFTITPAKINNNSYFTSNTEVKKEYASKAVTVTSDDVDLKYTYVLGTDEDPDQVKTNVKSLVLGSDYVIKSVDGVETSVLPTDQGSYNILIEGKGNYSEERTFTLIITQKEITPGGDEPGKFDDIYIMILDEATGNYDAASGEAEFTYTGYEIIPSIQVYYNGNTEPLTEGVDYTIKSVSNNVDVAGPLVRERIADIKNDHSKVDYPVITIEGTGNYTGSTYAYFNINPKELTASDISYVIKYDGVDATTGTNKMKFINGDIASTDDFETHKPAVTVLNYYKSGSPLTLKEGQDYNLVFDSVYDRNDARYAGKACFIIEAPTSYKDTRINSDGEKETYNKACNYTGVIGEITVTTNGDNEVTDVSSSNAYQNYWIGTDISSAKLKFAGSRITSVYNGLYVDLDENDLVEAVEDGGTKILKSGQYRIVAYKDPTFVGNTGSVDIVNSKKVTDITKIKDAGKYYFAIDGEPTKGTYASAPATSDGAVYTITPKSIAGVKISEYPETVYYTGDYIDITNKGAIKVVDPELPIFAGSNLYRSEQLKLDTDYVITNNKTFKDVGKAYFTVEGIGNYTGIAYAYFTIESNSFNGDNQADGSSSGTGITKDGVTIAAKDIEIYYDKITGPSEGYMIWTGKAIVPYVSIKYNGTYLTEGSDYSLSATNNINAGVGTLTITGKGGFHGNIIKKFDIKADLSKATVASIPDQSYTGSEITPNITIRCGGNVLTKNSDYTTEYLNNINVGKATVTAAATSDGYYYGTVSAEFNISNGATGMSVSGYSSSYVYTGYAISPDLYVTMDGKTLTPGVDYTVTYENNINVGTAKATVTGRGAYSGTKTITYTIQAKNISTVSAMVSGGLSYEYTGDSQTPSVTLRDSVSGKTLTNGTDYTISYSNNTDPGTATVSIKAISTNYTGTKTLTFSINSGAVQGLAASSVTYKSMKLKWDKQDYADGYQICDQNNKVVANTKTNSYKVGGLTSYKTYKFKVRSYVENSDGSVSYGVFSEIISKRTKLATPTLKVSALGKGKVKLSWTKSRVATGYEIYYSTRKNGIYTKLKTKSQSSTRSWNDTGLAAGEKYYYTVRAYRTVNGSKVYSNYSSIKGVTVK